MFLPLSLKTETQDCITFFKYVYKILTISNFMTYFWQTFSPNGRNRSVNICLNAKRVLLLDIKTGICFSKLFK